MRRTMFLCQDGVVLCTTLRALEELGVLEPSLEGDGSLADLIPGIAPEGFGALRVAVRTLAGVGWVAEDGLTLDPATTRLGWNERGTEAMRHRGHYVFLGRFLSGFPGAADDAWSRPWDQAQVEAFAALAGEARDRWSVEELPDELGSVVRAHLDAGLIVPTMLSLNEQGRLGEQRPHLPPGPLEEAIGELLRSLGWIDPERGEWTEGGGHARDFALSFGGVATYLPLLSRLPELYRGELTAAPDPDGGGSEWHVHRRLNLTISTKAHGRYFADADPIFVDVFDRPAQDRPEFIADMGCGDGAWLIHLHELLIGRLGGAPRLVGIDASPTALERARTRLDAAGIDALLLQGDVSDPGRLAADLERNDLAMRDGLHIRAFLDHEREYRAESSAAEPPGWTTGAYIDRGGRAIGAVDMERDLIAHLDRWASWCDRYGMVVLEAHCTAPRIASRNLGATHSVAFDAHQGYSQQYPIDHPAFMRCAHQAGLRPEGRHERRYPANRSFITISLNRFLVAGDEPALPATAGGSPREDTWRPDRGVDLEDGVALHEMLFEDGDVSSPRPWCCAPTGFVVAGTLAAIESRLGRAAAGDAIRVLDYGAGTGTASIELLKACRERGLDRRLADAGVGLELHLVDRPSSWFAKGYEVLGRHPWTRFHSVAADGGGFRPLLEVTGGRTMDAVMTNMVLHLIPSNALGRAAEQLASVTAPGGRMMWSSPDLGPPGPSAVLLHDPNRALRERWLELLHGAAEGGRTPLAAEAARLARERLDADALRLARERADRRILPHPLAAEVTAALQTRFECDVETRAYEMLSDEIVDGLLVPSNQAEFLPEIHERAVREDVIRELMTREVVPALQDGPAGTALGVNLHWALGSCARPA